MTGTNHSQESSAGSYNHMLCLQNSLGDVLVFTNFIFYILFYYQIHTKQAPLCLC